MKKQICIAVVLTGVLVLCLAVVKYQQISKAMAEGANRKPPATAVTSFRVVEEEWPRTISAVGTLDAVQGAVLSAEDGGQVVSIGFESGSLVQKGQLLLALDSDVEEAELEAASAQLELAQITLERQQRALKSNAISQSDIDAALAGMRNAQANVARLKALIERKKIIAPFSGRSGIRQVDIGQTLSAGEHVVSLQAFDRLDIDFSLPQQALGQISLGVEVEVTVDSYPERIFKAQLTAIESRVNAQTRNISIQATMDNPAELLRPGMFVRVKVILPTRDKVLSIPSSSVSFAPYGNSVFLIGAVKNADQGLKRSVKMQTVELGRRLGDRVSVSSGLKAGDEVVSSGTFKLAPGVEIIVNNSVMPESKLNPQPSDT